VSNLDQETQIRNSDVYDDTLAAGAGLETPVATDANILWDLNALRSQLRRVIDPQALVGTADWYVSVATALDNFGLRQIHDKKFVFKMPRDTNNAFTLGAGAMGRLVSSAMVAGGAGIIAVGPSSGQNNAYLAATEANFTIAGTLGVGLSVAASSQAVVLNEVDIFVGTTNDPPLDGGARVFGLLQVLTGTADGTAIAAAASENLQISFVKIDPTTDAVIAVTLPAATYQFQLPFQQSFYGLDRGAFLSGGMLPDIIDPGSTVARLPWRQFNVTADAAAAETFNVQTGVFSGTGTTTTFSSFGTPVTPSTAVEFRDDARCKIWRNGVLQAKGAGEDVTWVSTTQVSFTDKVKTGDRIQIESPATFV
jgi:hypothetical protein